MTKENLLAMITSDLGPNFNPDDTQIVEDILTDIISDALIIANRKHKANTQEGLEAQLDILSSSIKRAVKSIYLQRGAEDVTKQDSNGYTMFYDPVLETLRHDIIRGGKRLLI